MDDHRKDTLKLHRFKLSFAEKDLGELRRRLMATGWPGDDDNRDWRYGVKQSCLKELANYWLTDRLAIVEKQINAYSQYRILQNI